MKSLAELQAIRDRMQKQIDLRDAGDDRIRVVVGMATCGIAAGARPVLTAFLEEVQKRDLKNISVAQTGCIGVCRLEPIVEVYVPGQENTPSARRNREGAAYEYDSFPYPGLHRHWLLVLREPQDYRGV